MINKQIKEMRSDAFSELPDSLLIHILSFLDVKSAGITSVLSKRWKYLWAESPNLVFLGREVPCWGSDHTLDFVSWVNRTIDIRLGKYLEKFIVDFDYNDCIAFDVDVWIEFCVKSKVKDFFLSIYTPRNNTYYTPPQVMYSCSSLTSLHLLGCIMDYEGTIGWQCLTNLTLCEVMLNQHLVDEIISSCPVLGDLELRLCWGFNCLEVNSRYLNRLTIEESENEPFLEISAPYIRSLDITVIPEESKWQLRNISSVVKASIAFYRLNGDFPEESYVNEFLENFQHVNDLHVFRLCFEVLCKMAVDGLQLLQFRLRHLTIDSCSRYELGISGIIYLLKSSPNIETLILNGSKTKGEMFILDPAETGDLDSDLLHLKKIRVNNFADPNGEPLLTLARILLRRAPALEEMVIEIDVQDTSSIINISQTLLTYPRSSPKAEIHLSRN